MQGGGGECRQRWPRPADQIHRLVGQQFHRPGSHPPHRRAGSPATTTPSLLTVCHRQRAVYTAHPPPHSLCAKLDTFLP